jgi:hypothetical protein
MKEAFSKLFGDKNLRANREMGVTHLTSKLGLDIPDEFTVTEYLTPAAKRMLEAEKSRKAKREEIVHSIVTDGLLLPMYTKQEGRIPFRAGDDIDAPDDILFGRHIGPSASLTSALTRDKFSVLPVIAERSEVPHSFTKDSRRTILEERFQNSLLVVVPISSLTDRHLNKRNLLHHEVPVFDNIPPDAFGTIIVPESLHAEMHGQLEKAEVPFVTVKNRKEIIFRKLCTVPDYRGALKKVLADGAEQLDDTPGAQDIFIHGVRLPTTADMLEQK